MLLLAGAEDRNSAGSLSNLISHGVHVQQHPC